MKKIYVSSTFKDLKEFRTAVYKQLRKLRMDVVAMEDYVAGEKRPLAICVKDVAESDIYVGIFAWRYGYVPKENNPDFKSITELEYLAAGQHGKQRLIFLLRENTPWPPSFMDTHTKHGDSGKQIEQLRDELSTRHGVGFFTTPDELAKEVSAAVSNVIVKELGEIHDSQESGVNSSKTSTANVTSIASRLSLPWHIYKSGLVAARNIGLIEDLSGRGIATGFLVCGSSLHPKFGTDLYLLTPGHIIVRERNQKSFGLTVDQANFRLTISDKHEELIQLASIDWYSPVDELDLSIIRLQNQPEGLKGLAVADVETQPVEPADEFEKNLAIDTSRHVIVVGHPLAKQLSFCMDGYLLDHNHVALQYHAITRPGSGGSPIMDHKWRVLGVHRLRGTIPKLTGEGQVEACQAVSLSAIKHALKKKFG